MPTKLPPPGFKPSWMQCSEGGGCGRWFSRLADFDAHMAGYARRCLSDEELAARSVPFLRPEARRWSPETGQSVPTGQKRRVRVATSGAGEATRG